MKQLIFILLAIIGVSQAQTIQYIGAPTTTVISRGNFRTDSIFYLPKRTKLPTDTAALRYQISDSSLYAWTGSQWRKVGADADTLVYSTRAWRQKGDDSLAARINLKVNISDTASMLTPYLRKVDTTAMLSPYYRSATASAALALKLNISDTSSMLANYARHAGYGLTKSGQSFLVDTLNIATRAWRQKGLDSLAALEVSGSGTTNMVAKFTASGTIGNSSIFDNGSVITTSNPFVINPATAGASYQQYKYGGTDVALLGTDASISGGSASDFGIYTYGANNLDFWTNGSRRLRIFANGRIGINTTTDAGYQLDINGTLRSVNGANFATTSGLVGIGTASPSAKFDVDGVARIIGSGSAPSTGEGIEFQYAANQGEVLTYNRTGAAYTPLRVRSSTIKLYGGGGAGGIDIATSGNVGIGTVSPQQILHANAATGAYIQLSRTAQGGTTSPFGGIYFGDGTTFQEAAILSGADGNVVSGNMAFYTRAAAGSLLEGFRVNSTQELLVGGGSDAGDYKLQVSGNIYNTGSAVLAATSGNVGIGTASPAAKTDISGTLRIGAASFVAPTSGAGMEFSYRTSDSTGYLTTYSRDYSGYRNQAFYALSQKFAYGTGGAIGLFLTSSGETLINTESDAGDYKLQVVGNARIGTGKLDIASNTTFGLGIARSGTSEVAGQIYNSNGILYLGAESSAGGQIFSGSSAYAGVIGTGANYPLQFAVNNITRGGFSTSGNLLLGFTTDSYFLKLQVNGSIFSNNQFFGQGANAQLSIDSSTNISPLYVSAHSLTGTSAQAMLYSNTTWNTTGNPSLLDLNVTNTASGATSNYIKITDGTNTFRVTKAAEVVTAAPSGGSIKPWKLGEAATVSPTSPNRTIRVEIDGTVYYLHAKTTND